MELKKLYTKKHNFAGWPLTAGVYLVVIAAYALLRYGGGRLSLINLVVGLIFLWIGYRATQ